LMPVCFTVFAAPYIAWISVQTGQLRMEAKSPLNLMSSHFFGLLKTSEVPEKTGIFRCLPDERKARRNPLGPDRP
jgi:hypothetical protein